MKCLTLECKSEDIKSRGLCKKCYDRLAKKVGRGTTTWGQLIDQGLAQKATNCGSSKTKRQEAYHSAKQGNTSMDRILRASVIKNGTEILDRDYEKEPGDLTDERRKLWVNALRQYGGPYEKYLRKD